MLFLYINDCVSNLYKKKNLKTLFIDLYQFIKVVNKNNLINRKFFIDKCFINCKYNSLANILAIFNVNLKNILL